MLDRHVSNQSKANVEYIKLSISKPSQGTVDGKRKGGNRGLNYVSWQTLRANMVVKQIYLRSPTMFLTLEPYLVIHDLTGLVTKNLESWMLDC